MPIITQGKTNLKYILIVVILAAIVGGGILSYYYLWIVDLEARLAELEVKLSDKEGIACETDGDCMNIDCSKYPTDVPIDQEEGWCIFSGEKICWQNKCTCQLICT